MTRLYEDVAAGKRGQRHRCPRCRTAFIAQGSARFCSPACRQAAYRRRLVGLPPDAEPLWQLAPYRERRPPPASIAVTQVRPPGLRHPQG